MPIRRSRPAAAAAAAALTAIGALLVPGADAAAERAAEQVFREARGYTVRVRTQILTPFIADVRGSFEGAGFLVDAKRGWILTNAHVVGQSPSEVEIAFADQPFQPARKVYVDCFTDVAVLAVDQIPVGCRAAEIDCSDEVRIGEPIGVFGHPLGLYFTGTRGIVSGKTDQLGPDLLQIDATVDHGNSGGPMMALRTGRVVGIATAGAGGNRADRVNFATPMKDVGRILDLLRRGTVPSPAFMPLALLRDETGSHTLEVAECFDPDRWPLHPEDRIVAVAGEPGELRTLSDLVTALRGRVQGVSLVVERDGETAAIPVEPAPIPLVTEARGISLDGALIAPMAFEDGAILGEAAALIVHSVESSSTAEMLELEPLDLLHSVDGRRFTDLDSLAAYLGAPREDRALKVVFRRQSQFNERWFDYLVRELPGTEVRFVTPEPLPVAARHD